MYYVCCLPKLLISFYFEKLVKAWVVQDSKGLVLGSVPMLTSRHIVIRKAWASKILLYLRLLTFLGTRRPDDIKNNRSTENIM